VVAEEPRAQNNPNESEIKENKQKNTEKPETQNNASSTETPTESTTSS
jgi:hypothetical protein